MPQARDNQRKRVYDAEALAKMSESAAAVKLLHNGKRVTSTGNISIEACQAYVDYVTNSAWFQRRWGRRSLRVIHKVYGKATGGHGQVALPPWARTEETILHEIAHNLTPPGAAWHGPEFAAALLVLVKHMCGSESYTALRQSMREERVRVGALPKPDPAYARNVKPRDEIEAAVARRKREQAARERAEKQAARERVQQRLVSYQARKNAEDTLRALIKAGHFGPAGSASRKAALATARVVNGPSLSRAAAKAER